MSCLYFDWGGVGEDGGERETDVARERRTSGGVCEIRRVVVGVRKGGHGGGGGDANSDKRLLSDISAAFRGRETNMTSLHLFARPLQPFFFGSKVGGGVNSSPPNRGKKFNFQVLSRVRHGREHNFFWDEFKHRLWASK